MKTDIHPDSWEAYDLLHKGTLALARAERQGIRIDMDYITHKKKELSKSIIKLEEEFKESTFFKDWQKSSKKKVNINSSLQLRDYLYKVLNLKIEKETKTGKGSTDEKALKQLNIPALDLLLKMGSLTKMRDTYLDGFAKEQVDGYIHPFFNLHIPVTYRSSADSPNFQNLPNRDDELMAIVRSAIYPRPDHQLYEFDFKGSEVRISCAYHKDPTLMKYLNDPTSDMHGDLAAQLFCIDKFFDPKIKEYYRLRQAAKNGFVFPQFYGSYFKNCAPSLLCDWGKLPASGKWKRGQGIPMPGGSFLADHLISKGFNQVGEVSRGEGGRNVITGFMKHVKVIEDDFWKNRFPVYAKWKESWYEQYQKKGYIDMLTGFRCCGFMRKNDVTNYPIQGASFHCLLWCLIKLDEFLLKGNYDSKIIGQIHDSIVLDINPKEADIVTKRLNIIVNDELPSAWRWINVPVEMEMQKYKINGNWATKIN
jgi:DNA polymerase I-like protein with 3'-5' exonuclease and polymerase domains